MALVVGSFRNTTRSTHAANQTASVEKPFSLIKEELNAQPRRFRLLRYHAGGVPQWPLKPCEQVVFRLQVMLAERLVQKQAAPISKPFAIQVNRAAYPCRLTVWVAVMVPIDLAALQPHMQEACQLVVNLKDRIQLLALLKDGVREFIQPENQYRAKCACNQPYWPSPGAVNFRRIQFKSASFVELLENRFDGGVIEEVLN